VTVLVAVLVTVLVAVAVPVPTVDVGVSVGVLVGVPGTGVEVLVGVAVIPKPLIVSVTTTVVPAVPGFPTFTVADPLTPVVNVPPPELENATSVVPARLFSEIDTTVFCLKTLESKVQLALPRAASETAGVTVTVSDTAVFDEIVPETVNPTSGGVTPAPIVTLHMRT
jgi:hypothetical protein